MSTKCSRFKKDKKRRRISFCFQLWHASEWRWSTLARQRDSWEPSLLPIPRDRNEVWKRFRASQLQRWTAAMATDSRSTNISMIIDIWCIVRVWVPYSGMLTGGTCCAPDSCHSLDYLPLYTTAHVCVGIGSIGLSSFSTWPMAKMSTLWRQPFQTRSGGHHKLAKIIIMRLRES